MTKNNYYYALILLGLGLGMNACKTEDTDPPSLTLNTTSQGQLDDGEDGEEGEEEGGLDSTGGTPDPMCEPQFVEYTCRGVAVGFYSSEVSPGILRENFSPSNENILCVDPDPAAAEADLEEPAGELFDELTVCGPWHGLEGFDYTSATPSSQMEATLRAELLDTCREECLLKFSDSFPEEIDYAGSPWTFDHMECFMDIPAGSHWQLCPHYNPTYEPHLEHKTGPVPCGAEECSSFNCEGYDPGSVAAYVPINSTSGVASLDGEFLETLRENPFLLWECDEARYVQHITGSTTRWVFEQVGEGSLLYELGVRTGDKDASVWEFNPTTYARIGSIYPLDSTEHIAVAFDALINATGVDTFIAMQFTRGLRTHTIYIRATY